MSEAEGHKTHKRWCKLLDRRSGWPWKRKEGHLLREQYENGQQCGGCAFYVALEGSLGMDWGVCANPKSREDGKAVFEHFTCSVFTTRPEKKETSDR